MTLRDYQKDVLRRWQISRERRSLIVLPTATGKSFILAEIAQLHVRLSCRVLILSHRREILRQLYDRIVEAGVSADVMGLMISGDDRRDDSKPVQVASIDTFRRGTHAPFDVIAVDEAHRSSSKSYRKVIEAHPNARVIGFTATPTRLDDVPLGDLYDELIVGPSSTGLIAHGWLAKPRVFTSVSAELPALAGLRRRRGDFDRSSLEERVEDPKLSGSIVRDWKRFSGGLPTVAFAVTRKHAKSLSDRFVAEGVSAEVLDKNTPIEERDAIISRLSSGETKVVANVEVLTEGWDAPCVRCVILARPTLSLRLYLQMIGRAMRLGMERPIVLDHARNVYLHGMPDADREWSLDKRVKMPSVEGAEQAWRCPVCGALSSMDDEVCRECGTAGKERPKTARLIPDEDRMTIAELASFHGLQPAPGVTAAHISLRLRSGWDVKRSFLTPIRQTGDLRSKIREAAARLGYGKRVGLRSAEYRIVTLGMPLEEAVTAPLYSPLKKSFTAERRKKMADAVMRRMNAQTPEERAAAIAKLHAGTTRMRIANLAKRHGITEEEAAAATPEMKAEWVRQNQKERLRRVKEGREKWRQLTVEEQELALKQGVDDRERADQ